MAVEELDFYGLSRPVQERFIAATEALSVPYPIAIKRASKVNVSGWLVAGLLDLSLALTLLGLGFGNLESSFAIAPPWMILVAAGLLTSAVACFLRALVLRQRARGLPYSAAVYLFPVGVIEATSATLRLHPHTELGSAQAKGRRLRVGFESGKVFDFNFANDTDANQGKALVLEAKKNLLTGEAAHNHRALALLDPLRDNGFSSVFSPTTAFKRSVPTWARLWLVIALLLGAPVGVVLFKIRNVWSEERLYAAACAQDTQEAYRSYLARGGVRRDVVETLLPRAELKSAEAQGTVEAIERYIAEHREAKIESEITAALRSALLSELEKAKQQGTLSALHDLKDHYTNSSLIAKDLEQAEHDLYEQAFEKLAAAAAPGSEKANPRAFFRRLVSYAEQHGPKAAIRWSRTLYPSVRRMDLHIGLSSYYIGKPSIPSQYFDAAHSRHREEVASSHLLSVLGQHFPPDVLAFALGTPFDAPETVKKDMPTTTPPLPRADEPTVFISYGVEMNGHFTSPKPRGVYAGVGLLFHAVFTLPGDPEVLDLKFSMWRLPDLTLAKRENSPPDAVYENMASATFSSFIDKYLGTLFKQK